MNANRLAEVVVHWLEYERLCGRERLFREMALVRPIYDFLSAVESATIELEFPIPNLPPQVANRQGQKKCLDVCLRRPTGQNAVQDIVETKLVRGNRDFTQELFEDLFRLEWVRIPQQNEPFYRWFLVAGEEQEINAHIVTNRINPGNGQPRIFCFENILSFDIANPNKQVTVHAAVPNLRARWCKSATKLGQTNVPLSFATALLGAYPLQPQPNFFKCFVWRITRSQNRQVRPV